jgi:hypothetical protein
VGEVVVNCRNSNGTGCVLVILANLQIRAVVDKMREGAWNESQNLMTLHIEGSVLTYLLRREKPECWVKFIGGSQIQVELPHYWIRA